MRELTQKIRWTQNLKYKQLFAPPPPPPPPPGAGAGAGSGAGDAPAAIGVWLAATFEVRA